MYADKVRKMQDIKNNSLTFSQTPSYTNHSKF